MSAPLFRSRTVANVFGSGGATKSIASKPWPTRTAALEAAEGRDYKEYRDAAGVLRVRIGAQTDGMYGQRIWDSAGVLQSDLTYT